MKRLCVMCLFVLALVSLSAGAQESKWSSQLHYSHFAPDLDGWDNAYEDDEMKGWYFAMAYKPVSIIDLGVGVGYFSAHGQGHLPLNDTVGGDVHFIIYPVDVYLEFQGHFSANQWLIPYVGAGYSRIYYQIDIANQSDRKGRASGSHYKAGLKFSLNRIDPLSARQLSRGWGVEDSLLIVEAKWLESDKSGIDLGGRFVSFGLKFEF